MTKTILSFIGGFAIGFILIWAWNAYQDRSLDVAGQSSTPENVELTDTSTATSTESGDTESVISSDTESTTENTTSISVRDQAAGNAIEVQSATLPVDGWIVVHEEVNGVIGNALGAARRDAGTHADIYIPLLRNSVAGNRYWIVLYSDNGDRQFGLDADFPLRDEAGTAITRSFLAL